MDKLQDLDGVVLLEDFPSAGLHKGMTGTIVYVFTKPNLAYEVEFCGPDGETIAQVPLTSEKIRKIVT